MCYQYLKIQLISIPKILLCCLSFSFRSAFFCLPLLFHLFDGSFVRLVALSRSLWLFFLFVTCLNISYYNYSTFCGFVFFFWILKEKVVQGERELLHYTRAHTLAHSLYAAVSVFIYGAEQQQQLEINSI